MKVNSAITALEISLMKRTVKLSVDHVHSGGIPFSALVVDESGNVLSEGVNQVNELSDPTAHAEIMAIRAACKASGSADISGKVLYASGEPCALCYMAARFAGIKTIYIASDRHEAAKAGFDYRWTYDFFKNEVSSEVIEVKKLDVYNFNQPFEYWNELAHSKGNWRQWVL